MSFIPILTSLVIGVNISQCNMSIGIWPDYVILKGPNSDNKTHARKYTFESITTLKMVEGNYLHDYKHDELLKRVVLTRPSFTCRNRKKTHDYLYIVSPSFFYMSLDRSNYETKCLQMAREVLYPVIRQFWIQNDLLNLSSMQIKQ